MERPTTAARRTIAAYAIGVGASALAFAVAGHACDGRWPIAIWPWRVAFGSAGVALGGVLDKGGAGARSAVVALAIVVLFNAAWPATSGRTATALGVVTWLAHGYAVARCWSVRDWTGVAVLPGWVWATLVLAAGAR